MNPKYVWPSVVLACVAFVVAGIMAITKVPATTITLLLGLMVTPVLTALIAGQIAEVKGATNQVVQNTNGTLGRLVDIIEKQGNMLHAATPGNTQHPPEEPETEQPEKHP